MDWHQYCEVANGHSTLVLLASPLVVQLLLLSCDEKVYDSNHGNPMRSFRYCFVRLLSICAIEVYADVEH